MTLAARQHQIFGVWFEGQAHHPDTSRWLTASHHAVLQSVLSQLQAFFSKECHTFDLPLDLGQGTPFQQTVWQCLLQIPYGETSTYSQIAHTIGKPQAVRAVANAIARNRWMLVLPCHRVVGVNGALTGYAAGLQRKSALLAFESPM